MNPLSRQQKLKSPSGCVGRVRHGDRLGHRDHGDCHYGGLSCLTAG